MLASVAWLRDLCPFGESPAQVAATLTARGLTVDSVREVGGDAVLEVEVPANRPDCLGHLGLARELAAAFGSKLAPRRAAPPGQGDPVEKLARVAIDAPDLCGRYTARLVRGVRVGPSPAWVKVRLEACGLHAINNVVDTSNLVLLELGHPIHTFDLERLAESTLRVRRARAGETLTTLDGIRRNLDPEMLVIADARQAVAVAGVMGGADSQIVETTRDVLIEAAWFLPRSVRATARRLGLATDASHRFERGADPEGVVLAQEMAVRLLVELAGGTAAPGTVDAHPAPGERPSLTLRSARVRDLLGFDPGDDTIETALRAQGLSPARMGASDFRVVAPSWRVDLEREADLVEEVARHVGYDRIPKHLPSGGGAPPIPDTRLEEEERCRGVLAHLGFGEAFCYSMVGAGDDDPFAFSGMGEALALTNPIAEPMARLRRSLLAGLVRAADLNLRRGQRDVRLFEVGRVFVRAPRGGLPAEPRRVGIAWCGAARPRHWSGPSADVGLFDMIGVVDALIDALRPGAGFHRSRSCTEPGAEKGFHPARSTAWLPAAGAPGSAVAWCGAVHPDLRKKLDLDAEIFLAELDLDLLGGGPLRAVLFAPIPRVPAVTRDLSLVLDRALLFGDVLGSLAGVRSPAPAEFEVVDRYMGPPLKSGEVSLTVRVILKPLQKTLTDAETEAYRAALVLGLERDLGIRLRE